MALQSSRYISQLFGIKTHIAAWKGMNGLPPYLAQGYSWHAMTFGNQELLLAIPTEALPPPSILEKNLAAAQKKYKGPVAVVLTAIAPYTRQRFLQRKIAFIVPDKQAFIPELGIALREQRGSKELTGEFLPPSASHVVMLQLNHILPHETTLAEIARATGITLMSASRVANMLETAGLMETEKTGRTRCLIQKYSPRELWEHALPMLVTPVKHVLSVHTNDVPPEALEAGYLALSKATDLVTPVIAEFAVSRAQAKNLLGAGLAHLRHSNEEDDVSLAAVQVWEYPPFHGRKEHCVDPFSLFLCLSHDADERTAKALDSLLKETWSKE